MRPKSMLILLVILSAVLCQQAQPGPTKQLQQNADIWQTVNGSSESYNLSFQQFKQKYQKHYSSVAEQNYRKLIFQQNLAELNLHNSNPDRRYNKKPNSFLDVNQDQFKSVYTTVRPSDKHSRNVSGQLRKKKECGSHTQHQKRPRHQNKLNQSNSQANSSLQQVLILSHKMERNQSSYSTDNQTQTTQVVSKKNGKNLRTEEGPLSLQIEPIKNETSNTSLPQVFKGLALSKQILSSTPIPPKVNSLQKKEVHIDWSTYSGQVRFQGYCGACYAFATVDTISAHLAIYRYSFFIGLSVQQVIDCTSNQLTYGCNGGYLEGALTYIQMNGIVTQGVYPFTSGKNGVANTCKMSGGSFKVSSFQAIAEGSCSSVLSELYRGPVSAGIAGYNLRFYDSGVFDDCTKKDVLDHAVMIIGYDSNKGWRIKNSWGVDWGEKGYGWIADGNTCWICNMTVSITV